MSFYTISVSKHENETETVTCKTQTNTPKCLDSTGYPPGMFLTGITRRENFPTNLAPFLKRKFEEEKTALIRTPDLIRPTRRVLTLTTHRGLPPGDFLRGIICGESAREVVSGYVLSRCQDFPRDFRSLFRRGWAESE